MRIDQDMDRYFKIGDDPKLSYEEKLERYRVMAEDYFETERYNEFCAAHLPEIDEVTIDYIGSPEFDALLVDTIKTTFPTFEHDKFIDHYHGLLGAWVNDQP